MSVQVAVGLIEHRGHLVVGQRGPNVPLAGYWEFPGGKVEPTDASPSEAMRRECLEETGLRVTDGRILRTVEQDYPHAHVQIFFFRCHVVDRSEAFPALEAPWQWFPIARLGELTFPPANESVVHGLLTEYGTA